MLFLKFKLYSRDVFSFLKFLVWDSKDIENVSYNNNHKMLAWVMSQNFVLKEKYISILSYTRSKKVTEIIVKKCLDEKIHNHNVYFFAGYVGLDLSIDSVYYLYGSIYSCDPQKIDLVINSSKENHAVFCSLYDCAANSIVIAEYVFSRFLVLTREISLISAIEDGNINVLKFMLNKGVALNAMHLVRASDERTKNFISRRLSEYT